MIFDFGIFVFIWYCCFLLVVVVVVVVVWPCEWWCLVTRFWWQQGGSGYFFCSFQFRFWVVGGGMCLYLVADGCLHFQMSNLAKHLKMFSMKIFYSKIFTCKIFYIETNGV